MLPNMLGNLDLSSLEFWLRKYISKEDVISVGDAIHNIHNRTGIFTRTMIEYNLSHQSIFHDLNQAIIDMDKVIELEPDRDISYCYRAEILSMKLLDLTDISAMERNRITQKIRADYKRAREIEPTSGSAWIGLIEASLLDLNWDEAVGLYGECSSYTKTPEDQVMRALLGCVALALAGESIEEEDRAPLHHVLFPTEEDKKENYKRKRSLKEDGVRPLLVRLRHLVVNRLRGKPGLEKRWQAAREVVNTAIIEFDAWPKFYPQGYDWKKYDHYERALEMRWISEGSILNLSFVAKKAIEYESLLGNKDEPQSNITLTIAMTSNDKALEMKADDSSTWCERAIILEGLGQKAEALMALDRASELNIDPLGVGVSAKFMKARLLMELKRFQETIKIYDKIIGMHAVEEQSQALAWGLKAEALESFFREQGTYNKNENGSENGDTQEYKLAALAALERAIDLQPDFVEAWIHKAMLFDSLGRYEDALNSYNHALCIRPYYGILSGSASCGLWQKGKLLTEHLKRYEEALFVYDSVEEFVTRDYVCEVYLRQGEALEALGRYDEALKKFDDALGSIGFGYGRFCEYDADAWHRKAEIYVKLERHEEALKAYDKAIERRGTQRGGAKDVKRKVNEWRRKAELLKKLNRLGEAMQAMDTANKLISKKGLEWYELAQEFGVKGLKSDVLWSLNMAIEFSEDFKERAKTDIAFDFLRNDSDFQKILE